MGLLYRIKVSFLNPSKELAEARACFNILELPVSAGSEEDFYTRIDKSVLFSMTYFGQEYKYLYDLQLVRNQALVHKTIRFDNHVTL